MAGYTQGKTSSARIAKAYDRIDAKGTPLPDLPENRPFLIPSIKPASKAAILLVHGFTATPWEMRSMGEVLAASGYTSMGIRLPGHGTTPADLLHCRYEDWLQEVLNGYRSLAQSHQRVYAVGMSTGALLLLALAGRQRLEGLVLLSPFLRLRHRLAPLVGFLRFVKRYQPRHISSELAPHYYCQRPLNGVYQIYRLIRHVRSRLETIRTPALIFTARGDTTVDAASAHDLFRQLGSPCKRIHVFGAEVPHVLSTRENPRWQETMEQTLMFIGERERELNDGSTSGNRAP